MLSKSNEQRGATVATLTKTERFLLNEVDSCPDKVAPWSTLRMSGMLAGGLSSRGFSRVMDRMLQQTLLARDFDDVTLTFKGVQALRVPA